MGYSVAEPLVSVVVPAFNAVATLAETVASALGQSYRHLEVLIVDDGSTDATASVAAGLAARDTRVQVLRRPQGGLPSARNAGIAATRGDLLAFLDADDLWHPEKLRKQIAVLRRCGRDTGAVYAWYVPIDQQGRIMPLAAIRYQPEYDGDVYGPLILHNFLAPGSNLLAPRRCVEAIGGFDEAMTDGCEDLEFSLALAERFAFAAVPEVLVGYRQRAGSMSQDVARMRMAYDTLIGKVVARHPEVPPALLRWSKAKQRAHLARAYLRDRAPGKALRWLAEALVLDPLLPLTMRPHIVVGWLRPHPRSGALIGMPFLPPSPELTCFQGPPIPAFERRRRALAASLRVRSFTRGGRNSTRPTAIGSGDTATGR